MVGDDMFYSMDIRSDYIIKEKISSEEYWYNYFTLTVNAVNDAPVLLRPFEDLEILEASGAAAAVLKYDL